MVTKSEREGGRDIGIDIHMLLCVKLVTNKCYLLSHVQLFAALLTVAHQAPLSMGFSRQESWSELPFLSPGDVLHSEIKP